MHASESEVLDEKGRIKRATRHVGSYISQDANSDDDYEEEEEEDDFGRGKKSKVSSSFNRQKQSAPKAKIGSKRTKECTGCGEYVPCSTKVCSTCDHNFSAKSISSATVPAAAPGEGKFIREQFPFEPERDEDGSLLIQAILGRRPRSNTQHRRTFKPTGSSGSLVGLTAMEGKHLYEYLIKFKNLSYLKVQWLTASEIEAMNPKSQLALIRYINKLDRGDPTAQEEADIDPSFLEVEKILDCHQEMVTEIVDSAPPRVGSDGEVDDDDLDDSNAISSFSANSSSSTWKSSSSSSSSSSSFSSSTSALPNHGSLNNLSADQMVEGDGAMIVPPAKSKIWNANERCRRVLMRIWDDPFSINFQDPVDIDEYPDYLDIIDEPMSLSDVKRKVEAEEYSKYQKFKDFSHDMRLIFNNCKRYNLYKSQIWHTAHMLSLLFERLFQSWVLFYADGSLTITDPLGTPWEPSCRHCQSDRDVELTLLCDHCDAMFHTYCLRPKLDSIPDGTWMCPRCTDIFSKYVVAPGVNVKIKRYSAADEEEAKSHADGATSCKTVQTLKKKYLVKWRGLPYKECSWESAQDINDDFKISEFHRLNEQSVEDQRTFTQGEMTVDLSRARERIKLRLPASEAPHATKDLDATIYAQIRALHFLKHGETPPAALLNECGPSTFANVHGMRPLMKVPCMPKRQTKKSNPVDPSSKAKWSFPPLEENTRYECAEALANVVYSVARAFQPEMYDPTPARPPLPPAYETPSEIEVCLRKGNELLGMTLGEHRGVTIVSDFIGTGPNRQIIPGKKGQAELSDRIKLGDIVMAINGLYINHLPHEHVVSLINGLNTPYIYIRFLRIQQALGRQLNGVNAYLSEIRRPDKISCRPHLLRCSYFGVYPQGKKWVALCWNDTLAEFANLGLFDDEIAAAKAYDMYRKKLTPAPPNNYNFDDAGEPTPTLLVLRRVVLMELEQSRHRIANITTSIPPKRRLRPPTSRAIFLSSSKATALEEADEICSMDSRDSDSTLDTDSDEEPMWDGHNLPPAPKQFNTLAQTQGIGGGNVLPYQQSDQSSSSTVNAPGSLSRLLLAVNQSTHKPVVSDWEKYILEIGYSKEAADTHVGKRLQQIDITSGETIHVWDKVSSAASALNMKEEKILDCIAGKTKEAGSYRWVMCDAGQVQSVAQLEETAMEVSRAEWKSKLYKKSKEYRGGGALRDYQVEGLNWLLGCWYQRRSSILADEMGLGKTVQVVSLLEHLYEVENVRGQFLVCVPLSTIEHWRREMEGWTYMNVCLYHDAGGGKDMRDIIREFDWYYKGKSRKTYKFHVLITTYDDLIRDAEELSEVPWRVVVVDEAHRLKSNNSRLADCMRSVISKGQTMYGYQHRILMTGTPLQNNTAELFSLLNFIEQAKFPDAEKFARSYGTIETQEQVENLQRRIAPHLLRRVKEDVAKDIPPKEETIIDVELTTMQKQYYRAIYERNHGFLMQSLKNSGMPKLMNIQMELRKCCNHPLLINGVDNTEMEAIERKMFEEFSASSQGDSFAFNKKDFQRRRIEEVVIPSSGKMVLVDKLLPKLKKEGHKVLIFSQMVKMIDIIEEFCEFRGYSCERLDGRVSGNERQKSIDRFNKDPNSFVFLLSTRAGGVGINLTAADVVIIFDSDWNPQNDVQAMARCHRIGQSKNVTIYRLITRKSFEAEMFDRASRKLGLEAAILGSRQFDTMEGEESSKNEKIDAKEMEQLLREGAYAVLLEDDSNDLQEFCSQDIDQILTQRAHTIVSETGPRTESWLNKRKKANKTRKSAFTGDSSMEHAEIDVNDPDFWKKVLPDLVTPDTMLARLENEILGIEKEDETGVMTVPTRVPGATTSLLQLTRKFMSDTGQMMDGMIDLNRRGQLPERERIICQDLLLRITMKTDHFEECQRVQAQEWLSILEGARVRRSRQDLFSEQSQDMKQKKGAKKGRGTGLGKSNGSGPSRGNKRKVTDGEGEGPGAEGGDGAPKQKKKKPPALDEFGNPKIKVKNPNKKIKPNFEQNSTFFEQHAWDGGGVDMRISMDLNLKNPILSEHGPYPGNGDLEEDLADATMGLGGDEEEEDPYSLFNQI